MREKKDLKKWEKTLDKVIGGVIIMLLFVLNFGVLFQVLEKYGINEDEVSLIVLVVLSIQSFFGYKLFMIWRNYLYDKGCTTLIIQNCVYVRNCEKEGINLGDKLELKLQWNTETLLVTSDDRTTRFRRDYLYWRDYKITKVTDEYIIGEEEEFYLDIKNQQLYFMDYFPSRYEINSYQYEIDSYGKDYSVVKETNVQMMNMLKEGKTQKDVISHLIKQTEYDF